MNFAKYSSILVLLIIQSAISALSAQSVKEAINSPIQHAIVIKQWELARKKGDVLFMIEFDGKLLHPNEMAVDEINNVKFEPNSLVKVMLPLPSMPADNILRRVFFLHHAIDDGASLSFYRGEKKMNYHVLLFQHLRTGPTSEEKHLSGGWNTDTAVFNINGKKFFNGHAAAAELKKLTYNDKLVFVLYPEGFNPLDYNFGLVDKSEIDSCVKSLQLEGVEFVAVGCAGSNGWPVPIIGR